MNVVMKEEQSNFQLWSQDRVIVYYPFKDEDDMNYFWPLF